MTDEIRKEEGCKSCNFFQNVDNENIFSLAEEWNTREELDIHLKSDIFSALIGTKSLLVKPPDIHVKTIAYKTGMEAVRKARGKRHT
jgi:quinol monooxygenase YgiN